MRPLRWLRRLALDHIEHLLIDHGGLNLHRLSNYFLVLRIVSRLSESQVPCFV